jgi:hypothetical protein
LGERRDREQYCEEENTHVKMIAHRGGQPQRRRAGEPGLA